MTDTRPTTLPVTPSAGAPAMALKVRQPVLRRPPGWGVLDEPALRVRAAQLYLACMQQVQQEACAGPRAANVEHAPAGPRSSDGPGTRPAYEHGAHGHARTEPSSERQAAPHAEPAPRKGSHWHLLPWGLLLGGMMLLAPWLIWAPLVGGVCLGLLLLQTGMLRRWVRARAADDVADADVSARRAGDFSQSSGRAGEPVAVESVQGVGPPRLRFAHGGWMLTAALALVGVQAAMLITTFQFKSREPAAVASAIRAAHPERDRRQALPPGAQEPLAPLQGRAPAIAPPTESERSGPATRSGGAAP